MSPKRMVVVTVLAVAALAGCGQRHHGLPASLGGLALSRVTAGEEARSEIEAMHREPLPGAEHLIAAYGDAGAAVTLYASRYPDPDGARQDLMRMAMRLAEGTEVFEPLEIGDMGGSTRFCTRGLGLDHLFFRHGSLLLWLQAPAQRFDAARTDLEAADLDRVSP